LPPAAEGISDVSYLAFKLNLAETIVYLFGADVLPGVRFFLSGLIETSPFYFLIYFLTICNLGRFTEAVLFVFSVFEVFLHSSLSDPSSLTLLFAAKAPGSSLISFSISICSGASPSQSSLASS
jgi:hypothetical protein